MLLKEAVNRLQAPGEMPYHSASRIQEIRVFVAHVTGKSPSHFIAGEQRFAFGTVGAMNYGAEDVGDGILLCVSRDVNRQGRVIGL